MGGSLRAELLLGVSSVGGTESPFSQQNQQQYHHNRDHHHYRHNQQQHHHHQRQQQEEEEEEQQQRQQRQKSSGVSSTWKRLQKSIRRSISSKRASEGLRLLTVFPSSVAMWAGVVKLFVGGLMGVLGGVGIAVEAALSSLGGGLWAGAVVAVSGFLAVCASRQPLSQVCAMSV